MKKQKFNKTHLKKTGDELQEYLTFRRRGSKVEDKTKYNRQKFKRGE